MEKRLQAVYKHGALYPLEPLQLQDMQEVTLTITDTSAIDEDLAGYFTAEEWLEAETDTVTWDEVRRAVFPSRTRLGRINRYSIALCTAVTGSPVRTETHVAV
jgi:predicted DNA-binding antitoxin AbrB/MazE fold protein